MTDTVIRKKILFERDGRKIAGEVYLPAEGEAPFPTVILSHGFGVNMKITRPYAREFAKEGAAAVIFDFIGGGLFSKSGGDTREMSVLTEAEDLKAVLDAVRELPEADPGRIFLFGESQGGFVSTYVAAEEEEKVAGLVCLYPAYVIQDHSKMRLEKRGSSEEPMLVMGTPIGAVYDRDAVSFDLNEMMKGFSKDVLMIHGTADRIVPISYSERALGIFPSAELKIIPGAGHGFQGKARKSAAEWTMEFVRKHS